LTPPESGDTTQRFSGLADRLEQTRYIAGGHWVARLGAPILAGVAQIGRDGGDARCPGILQGADEKQQPAELVVGTCGGPTMEAVHHIDVGVANVLQRTCLVLAILEIPLFVHGQRLSESLRNALAEFRRRLQCKKPKAAVTCPCPTLLGWRRAIAVGTALRLCRLAGRRRGVCAHRANSW
jgi:hypothetical protein